MTPEELKTKLDAHKLWLETRDSGEVKGERLDLNDADLNDADLSYADLSYASLVGADLGNANLTGADLTFAELSYADLTNAILTNANLSRADLTEAILDVRAASPLVYDALAEVFAARIALLKTRTEWKRSRR